MEAYRTLDNEDEPAEKKFSLCDKPACRIFCFCGAYLPESKSRMKVGFNTISAPRNFPAQVEDCTDGLKVPFFDGYHSKVLDQKRWLCIVRPQYPSSSGISSLISCWNFIFSRLGYGEHDMLTQEQALMRIGLMPPFEEIMFGRLTANKTLKKWWLLLNESFGIEEADFKVVFRLKGAGATHCLANAHNFLDYLFRGLQDESKTYIYHCKNHYMCLIGFIRGKTPETTWILAAETCPNQTPFHMIRWSDLVADLLCMKPEVLDVRRVGPDGHPGIQMIENFDGKGTKKNFRCIMEFSVNNYTSFE